MVHKQDNFKKLMKKMDTESKQDQMTLSKILDKYSKSSQNKENMIKLSKTLRKYNLKAEKRENKLEKFWEWNEARV